MSKTQSELRLLSWNVWNENHDEARITACISETRPDVVLLQEALPAHLNVLIRAFSAIVTGRDYIFRGETCHLAIATDLDIIKPRVIAHFGHDKPSPSPLGRWMQWVEFLDTISATIAPPEWPPIRLINIHTSAAVGPSTRRSELVAASSHIPEHGPCIFAGDFNSFAEPWLSPLLAWPLGYSRTDMLVRERRDLERWLAERGFKPTVSGVTFPRFRMKLDGVFVRELSIASSEVLAPRFGSDHRPILTVLSAVHPSACR